MTASRHTIRGGLSLTLADLSAADLDEAVTALSQGEGYSGIVAAAK